MLSCIGTASFRFIVGWGFSLSAWNIMLKTESLKHPEAVYFYSSKMQDIENIYYGHVIPSN